MGGFGSRALGEATHRKFAKIIPWWQKKPKNAKKSQKNPLQKPYQSVKLRLAERFKMASEDILVISPFVDRRRKPPGERRRWNPKQLSERHFEMVLDMSRGMSNKALADKYGMDPVSVSCLRNSTLCEAQLKKLRMQKVEILEKSFSRMCELTEKAVGVYEEVLDGTADVGYATKLKAAKEVLTHPAVVPPERREGDVHFHLHKENMDAIKMRGMEIARQLKLVGRDGTVRGREREREDVIDV